MNLALLDGKINSSIERVLNHRALKARFTVATLGGDTVAVEVRGAGAERVCNEWEPGDSVHIRGHVTTAGCIAADLISRLKRNANQPIRFQAFERDASDPASGVGA